MTQRTPRISGDELIAVLQRAGFQRLRQEGSHVRLIGPHGHLVTVKRTRETLKPKTLASALRQAGWSVEDLRTYL